MEDAFDTRQGYAQFEQKMIDLRIKEIEAREQVLAHIKEINQRKLWKELGFTSLAQFCEIELGYDPAMVREILIQLHLVVPAYRMTSDDSATQKRIDRLREWRKQTAARSGIAAYRVVTNRTLISLAEALPRTAQDLEQIPGIGVKKIQEFGNEILVLLNGH